MPCDWNFPNLSAVKKICLGTTPSWVIPLDIIDTPCPNGWEWELHNPPPDNTHLNGSSNSSTLTIPAGDFPGDYVYTPASWGIYKYYLTVTGGGISKTVELPVHVYPVLSAQVLAGDIPDVISVTEMCWGEFATLNMAGVPPVCQVSWKYRIGTSGTWNSFPGGGLGNPYSLNQINLDLDVWGATNGIADVDQDIEFKGTVIPSCGNLDPSWPSACSNVQTVTLAVWATPQAGNLTALPEKLCTPPYEGDHVSDTIQLYLGGNILADSFTWSYSGPPGGTFSFADPSDPLGIPTFSVNQAGTYDITVVIGNGPVCSITERTVQVIIEHPFFAEILSDSTERCWGQDAHLTVNHDGPPGCTVRWEYHVNGNGDCDDIECDGNFEGPWYNSGVTGLTQNTNELFGHSYDPLVIGLCIVDRICWRAKVTSPTGICTTTTAPVTIKVIQPPSAPTIQYSGSLVKCPTAAVILTASVPDCGTGPFTYQWFCNGVTVAADGPTCHAIEPGNYTVTVFSKDLCAFARSEVVTVSNCTISVEIDGPCTCKPTNAQFVLTAVASCSPVPPGDCGDCPAILSYHWNTGHTIPTTIPPIHCPPSTTTYSVVVTSEHTGCSVTALHSVKRCTGGKKGGKS